MLAMKAGDGCCRCGETVRALARRKVRNSLPSLFPSEVGVVGVKLELYFVLQAIEHCMEHIGVFGKESGVYTYVIDHRLFERTVQKAVFSGKIIGFMWLLFDEILDAFFKGDRTAAHIAAT